MNNEFFKQFIIDAKNDNRILFDPRYIGQYKELMDRIYKDVETFDIYTLDGRFPDVLKRVVNNISFNESQDYYEQLLYSIYNELKQLVVPNMILIPLNNLKPNFKGKDYIEIAENIRIYPPTNINYRNIKPHNDNPIIKNDKLSEYFEQSVYAKLLQDHIVLAKDHHFFNSPIMTILINNIDYKVEHEAAKITEAVYSLIRMVDFDVDLDSYDYCNINNLKMPASTYGVYFNEPNTSPNPPYDNGYGNCYIFKFDPILDVNPFEFHRRIERLKSLIENFVSLCFIDRSKKTIEVLQTYDKWMNAVLLYNSAYEFASKEKYDATTMTLLTILESLFLNNIRGEKKSKLAEQVAAFLEEKGFDYNNQKIKDLILDTYKHRSKYVHEGITYNLTSYKSIIDRQGAIPGMKPFSCSMFDPMAHNDAMHIYMLFRITGYVIMSYFD